MVMWLRSYAGSCIIKTIIGIVSAKVCNAECVNNVPHGG